MLELHYPMIQFLTMIIINEWLVQYLLNIAAASVERGARKKKAFLSSFTVFFIVCLKTRKIFF